MSTVVLGADAVISRLDTPFGPPGQVGAGWLMPAQPGITTIRYRVVVAWRDRFSLGPLEQPLVKLKERISVSHARTVQQDVTAPPPQRHSPSVEAVQRRAGCSRADSEPPCGWWTVPECGGLLLRATHSADGDYLRS
jgi:hypothetical protein